ESLISSATNSRHVSITSSFAPSDFKASLTGPYASRFFSTRFMLKPNKFGEMISSCVGDPEMKLIAVAFIFVFSTTILAQQSDMQMKMPEPKPVEIYSGLGTWHHATSTKNPEAQRFFDQGLRMTYGFNHEEAVRSFK